MAVTDALTLFKESGALLEGHFLLSSGLHSPQYFQCAQVLQYPEHAQQLCWEIAYNFMTDKITTVIAPAIGGIIVAHEVARLIKARALFTEREQGKMTLRRGFKISKDDNVLIVEDVVTTGGSVREIIDLVNENGARLKGIGFIVDRSEGKVQFPVKTFSVIKMNVVTYQPAECPQCNRGVPLIKPGSRK